MDIDHFNCTACGQRIESFAVRQALFHCPKCSKEYRSNYKVVLNRSLYTFAASWISIGVIVWFFTSSWQLALALSIELGWVGAIIIAVLGFRRSLRIDEMPLDAGK